MLAPQAAGPSVVAAAGAAQDAVSAEQAEEAEQLRQRRVQQVAEELRQQQAQQQALMHQQQQQLMGQVKAMSALDREDVLSQIHAQLQAVPRDQQRAMFKTLPPIQQCLFRMQQQYRQHHQQAQAAATGSPVGAAAAPAAADSAELPVNKYCTPTCRDSGGEMIGCDTEDCPHGEWFHPSCVGLLQAPAEDVPWFCPGCKR